MRFKFPLLAYSPFSALNQCHPADVANAAEILNARPIAGRRGNVRQRFLSGDKQMVRGACNIQIFVNYLLRAISGHESSFMPPSVDFETLCCLGMK